MFTKKVKHTLKILMALAREREGEGRLLRIEDLAERTGVPRNYVYELILNIREAGIIASVHGRTGGYRLVKEPADVSIPEFLRLLGGTHRPSSVPHVSDRDASPGVCRTVDLPSSGGADEGAG